MQVPEEIIWLVAIGVFFILLVGKAAKKGAERRRNLKSQRSCGTAGRNRTKAEARGDFGERQVSCYLADLPREDYEIFNDILIRDRSFTTQIDHVIISRFGVFVLETKNVHGKIYGSENSEFWKQFFSGGRRRHEYQLRNPIWQNEGHIKALQRLVFGSTIPIRGIVVFPPEAKLFITTKSPVLYMWDITGYIRQFQQEVLSSQQVEEFRERLIQYASFSEEDRAYHLENVARSKNKRTEALQSGKCPRCGGNLILRSGRYGQFYGCSNYPECNYKYSERSTT